MVLIKRFFIFIGLFLGVLASGPLLGDCCTGDGCRNLLKVLEYDAQGKPSRWFFENNEGVAGDYGVGWNGRESDATCAKCGDVVTVHNCDSQGNPCPLSDNQEECERYKAFLARYGIIVP